MKAIKSKKWYENQITVRENALRNLSKRFIVFDYPYPTHVIPKDITAAKNHNTALGKECGAIDAELKTLRHEYHFYHRNFP